MLVSQGMSVTLPVKGRSMLPFIVGGRDSVVLRKPGQTRTGDVVLAWVDESRYVLHRIVRIDRGNVTLMGDGNLALTEHCSLTDIKAVATHVVAPGGRAHSLSNRWARSASRLWCWLLPVRKYLLFALNYSNRKK